VKVRDLLVSNPNILINLERYVFDTLFSGVEELLSSIKADYNEASNLFPFWQNYPPDERGRKPRGDQFPWIEVGEHAVGDRIKDILEKQFLVRSIGLPSGPDERFVSTSDTIKEITNGITNSCWVFVDIKSAGPRDDHAHTVMSHNQMTGSGEWTDIESGVKNRVMQARGQYSRHDFHSSLPPVYVLSDGTILPVVNYALKPVYKMLSLEKKGYEGQPLSKIQLVSIPNGLLLECNPNYLKKYPGLIFPGKDDKDKNPLKVRARIDFNILREIDDWRVGEILIK
jgi:hypothetical protein